MNSLPIQAMGLVLFAWLLLFLIFIGVGLYVLRIFNLKSHSRDYYLRSFWIGWASVIVILQLWHLFFRVDWKAIVLVSVIGIAGIIRNRAELWILIKEKIPQNHIFCLLFLFSAIMLANRAVLPPLNYDSGLYHLTTIRWNASYPVVPGLGNLHCRLALNSSYFLYVALLEILTYKSHHFANGLLLLILLAQIFLSFTKLLKNNIKFNRYHIYLIFCFFPVVKYMQSYSISSPLTDFPIFILGVLLSSQLLLLLENLKYTDRNPGYDLFYITVLGVIGLTIKWSYFVLAISSLVLAFGVCYFKFRKQGRSDYPQQIKKPVLYAAITILPWMLRNFILSGYFIYPNTLFFLDVDWRMPRASVLNYANCIHGWARTPLVHWSKVLGNRDWLLPWLLNKLESEDIIVPLTLCIIGAFFVILKKSMKKSRSEKEDAVWMFILPAILSIIYWFFAAPDPRFLGFSFWALGIGLLSMALEKINFREAAVLFISLLIIYLLHNFVMGKRNFVDMLKKKNISGAFKQLKVPIVTEKGDEAFGFYRTTQAEVKRYRTNSGLTLYVPIGGDQCWDAPLPCTPYPHPYHALRREGDMRYGFKVYPRDEEDPTVGNK